MTMPIDRIPDWEKRLARQDAFWECEIIDRPVVQITVPSPDPEYPMPKPKSFASLRERWMDTEHMVEQRVAWIMNTGYLGDALPLAWPNLGPEIVAAFYGAELEFTPETSWAIPCLETWEDADRLRFSEDNFYWKKILEMTEALLGAGRGKVYVGITDLHCAADIIAAFRDPLEMNADMIEHPEAVREMTQRLTKDLLWIMDFYHEKLIAADQAVCSWPGIVSTKRWYVPSNDFSCMISPKMFNEFFLEELIEECTHLEASLYHLDGPDALCHLESLLAVKELNAIQWIYGAGHGRPTDWMDVYKRCQQAGKGLQFTGVQPDEIDILMENLRPEGVWMAVAGVREREHAGHVLKQISRWK